jgi:hypothetical protein
VCKKGEEINMDEKKPVRGGMKTAQKAEFDRQAAADIETARKKGIPKGLEIAVTVTEDEAKRKVTVSAMPRKSQITLNEWQVNALADNLTKILQKWSGS